MTLRRRTTPLGVPPAVEHYLATGCWRHNGIDLDTFIIAGHVLRGRFDGLRALWRTHGDALKRSFRDETWAERMLATSESAGRSVPGLRCPVHG